MLPQIEQFYHLTLAKKAQKSYWQNLHGCSSSLAIACQAMQNPHQPFLIITSDILSTARLEQELRFYLQQECNIPIHIFPDWETLPYDHFSPHEDIVSQRLLTLGQISNLTSGIILVAATTLMHKLPPKNYVEANSFILEINATVDIEKLRKQLVNQGYISVTKVMSHGEFASRGSIIDVFPVGSKTPFRIDLFDTKVDSIRIFNPQTQISSGRIDKIRLLPAKEYPLTDEAISRFRRSWRTNFSGDPLNCPIYQSIINHESHPGIEYYLPLFFEQTAALFDYLPANCTLIKTSDDQVIMEHFWQQITSRYEQLRHNRTHPLLAPVELFITVDQIFALENQLPQIIINSNHPSNTMDCLAKSARNNEAYFQTADIGDISIDSKAKIPLGKLQNLWQSVIARSDSDVAIQKNTKNWIASQKTLAMTEPKFIASEAQQSSNTSMLLITESAGRREVLLESLKNINLNPITVESWQAFIKLANTTKNCIAITVAPLDQSVCIYSDRHCEPHAVYEARQSISALDCFAKSARNDEHDNKSQLLIITETQIFGANKTNPIQYRSSKIRAHNPETIIRDLTELSIGAPVVHIDHGIGRYLGLQKIAINSIENEFLILEYADAAKLYVPVATINLINRYTGMAAEHVTLNHLGSKQWEKTKREAKQKTHDAAVEILEIHARRADSRGFSFTKPDADYQKFAASFNFIETPDQAKAINEVIADMTSDKPMDRLICGDVGFGKTEIAMRAAFIAANSGKQVAILAPTTLLAQQHFTNFQDRFVEWPISIALFTRFKSTKEQKTTLENLSSGKIDVIIGTHKLLQDEVKFSNLGLLIVDEEHRFGVKQKERIKKLAPNIDILTLTATPIPRTLNMAFASIRDFSIIATPPAKRLAIKTFVHEQNDHLIKEAIAREILRGGQVYFLHNDVATMAKTARHLQQLVPNARIAMAHGQMRKQELEQVMSDFYRIKINVLICSTIIESGIDVPTANTIIIDRADCFGLAQLHQLRGRVGRSHHQAYAYLITPPEGAITADAKKRLEAITSLEDLGSGFILATHDLEIRGAGELLGEEQSGAIQNIGFSLYMEMLQQAIETLKSGKDINLEDEYKNGADIELPIPALIPDSYIQDMNLRLVLYKRIASSKTRAELDELFAEMIDRFGKLPETTKNLFKINQLRLTAQELGILKITAGANGKGSIEFCAQPKINLNLIIQLVQKNPNTYKFKGSQKIEFIVTSGVLVIDFITDLLKTLIQ